MKAKTIDEVIERLQRITEEFKSKKNPLGIFSFVYLGVTISVKEQIAKGYFEDGPRMERLDVIFANRYLEAYDCFSNGKPCSSAWKSTFEIAVNFDLLAIQYLLMGMNAHINLDLGIAASETLPPHEIDLLEGDFKKINQLLLLKIDELQDKISFVSPLFFLLDWFGKRRDEQFAEFSITRSRDNAWKAAKRLSPMSLQARELEIKELDDYVTLINRLISQPTFFTRGLVKFIKWFEVKDVVKVMEALV